MATENREIKSGVFADLFCDDEIVGKRNFLSLYNAIHGTDLKPEDTVLENKRIPGSLYKTFYNDISMLVDGRLIVLIEHQSTPNANMPLRLLEYYVHLLYGMIPAKARYKEKLFKIPTPEFYVFYNGTRRQDSEAEMKLSDAFLVRQEKPACEVLVKFVNIRGKEAANLPIVKKCDTLRQYNEFMEIVLRHQAEASNAPEGIRLGCYEKAIREAISRGILTDYLERKGTEVMNMFIGEYDYDLDMEVKAEEAREEGFANGLAEGERKKAEEDARNLYANGVSVETIAKSLRLSEEQVMEIVSSVQPEDSLA